MAVGSFGRRTRELLQYIHAVMLQGPSSGGLSHFLIQYGLGPKTISGLGTGQRIMSFYKMFLKNILFLTVVKNIIFIIHHYL